MSPRKFYRTKISFEVLSDVPMGPCMDLVAIAQECVDGDWMKGNYMENEVQITAKQAARLSVEFGGEPRFFKLDNQGNEIPE